MDSLNWIDVKSSNIKKIAFKEGKLYVTFKNDQVYSYEKFTKEKFDEMKKAESIGKFFHQKVINKHKAKSI